MSELSLNVTKNINANINQVFDAWLDPKMLSQFMTPMPGMPNSDVVNDAIEGGKFTVIMHAGENQLPHTGEYLEINRPNKLVFTWQSAHSIDGSVVTLNFKELDDNQTEVVLTHVKFLNEQARGDHQGGWTNILENLSDLLDV